MINRKNEYMMILVINILLALYTIIFLYGSPNALYKLFSVHTVALIVCYILAIMLVRAKMALQFSSIDSENLYEYFMLGATAGMNNYGAVFSFGRSR